MKKLFLFFDLGQTLIDESKFINFLDQKLLELINGFGGRIDFRNYITLRNNIIKNRIIGNGGIEELITNISRLILPKGYDKIILKKITPFIPYGKKEFFFLKKGATLGKSLFHLKVCKEDGKPLGLIQAICRSFLYLLSALPLGLGFFWVQLDSKHRTWHDKFSRTKVILD